MRKTLVFFLVFFCFGLPLNAEEPAMKIQRLAPETLPDSSRWGYAQVVTVSGGTAIYIAGQVGVTPDGQIPGDGGFAAQAEQLAKNVRAALEAAGAKGEHLVQQRLFVVDLPDQDLSLYSRAAAEHLYFDTPRDARPAGTVVGVSALARPEYLIELEAVAVLPD